ncbi:acyl-CoA thioesterase [Mycoplana rhizolycopersici]|uniref:Acyl-CoA thioesterase II n=1 Tax=Mycoplana rhizolycopersici TaxID=2746702 RepID=A0ABX2Q831_9HYPH|nr:acyl-CoA thioesterase II [Rhizobium rhizolycopersici]NVP53858.1 acyl-CoA thioesterase II [Rhizobium rhizolycopersici]
MSQAADARTPMGALLSILDLETLEVNLFRGRSPQVGWQRVFGGQVIAQATIAASRTVEADRFIHSLHAYFIRPGDPSVPILYDVDRVRDGATFTTRRVIAIQHGKPIYFMTASFHQDEGGYEHSLSIPDVPPPEAVLVDEEARRQFLATAPKAVRDYWERPRPIELRPVELTPPPLDGQSLPIRHVWMRATGSVPHEQHLQAAVLGYLSDMTLLDTALFGHGTSVFDPTLQVASLDHAMWFHRPFDLDDWILYAQDSPSASGGRGMTRGSLFSRSGALIASVAQEGLIRKKAIEQK